MALLEGVSDLNKRVVRDYDELGQLVTALKQLGIRIVVTIGTFDLIHVGHSRYLEKAKDFGDILIVGTDTDRAVRSYKGENRPIVPEDERLEMLLHTRYVDFATLIDDVDEKGDWQFGLLDVIRPDIFVAIEESYPLDQRVEIEARVGKLELLPRQAETSTSEKIRQLFVTQGAPVAAALRSIADRIDAGEGVS